MKRAGLVVLSLLLIVALFFIAKTLLEKSKEKVVEFTSDKLSEWAGMDISFEDFSIDEGRFLEVTGLRITTPYPLENYAEVNAYHTDWLDIKIGRLMLGNFSYSELIENRKFHASILEIDTATIFVYRDKNLPDPPFKKKPLVSTLLREMNAGIHLDSILLRKISIVYEEKGEDFESSGQLRFENLYASGYNLTNIQDKIAIRSDFSLDVIADLMGKNKINAMIIFDLTSQNDHFSFIGNLEPFELDILNPMIIGVLPAEITSGHIHHMSFDFTGNDTSAKGWLDLQYKNLKIQIFKDDNESPALLKTMAANVLIRSNNIEDRDNYRKGEILFVRNQDRFIFNYWWRSLQTGMADIMLTDLAKSILSQTNSKDD
ncbi:MAG: hypothetical protein JJU28_18660 [Cyclobacteriaceae bacterium]|nr:hypothetical protein [Cyclobacteriaceae bacterium]